VTVERNVIKNSAAGFQLSSAFSGNSLPMNHLAIRNNVAIGIDAPAVAGFGLAFQITGGIANLSIEHNTMLSPPAPSRGAITYANADAPRKLLHHMVRDNLFGGGQYPLFVEPGPSWSAITDTTSRFTGNVLAATDAAYWAVTRFGFPASNTYLAAADAIGFVGGGAAATDPAATLDQLALAATSPYAGKGADIAAVKAAIANVVQATPSGRLPIRNH
jgi:hypothetical protein